MATAGSHNDDCADVYFKRDSCRIIFKLGDLLSEENIDAIVIPTPEYGQRASHSYPLYEALLSRADQGLSEQVKQISQNIKSGGKPQNISTGKKGIILTPTPFYQNVQKAFQLLKSTYTACLNLAVHEKYQTIAFPTIGCGNSGFPSRDAAANLHETLSQFNQPKDKKLTEIRIIIYDRKILVQFTDVFIELSKEKNAKIKFDEIVPRHSNSANMPSDRDRKQTSQQRPRDDQGNDYPDDFDDDATGNQRDAVRRQSSKLDPESSEFRPKYNNQRRPERRYRINEKKTELIILQGDILRTKVDAIVNAANEHMLGGGGVDGVIHKAAGDELRRSCKAHKEIFRGVRLPTGSSRILLSYNMSKTTYYIINTSGPRYEEYQREQCKKHLISCYKTSLALANLYDLETIGFTAISCGIFGYPLDEGAEVALTTVDRKAGTMRAILFVLKDDDIYDAWVKKAKELKFLSLDEDDTPTAVSTSTQPNKDPGKTSTDDDSTAPNPLADLKVNDQSTTDNTDIPPESPKKKLESGTVEESDNAETTRKKEDDNESDTDKTTNEKKSEKQNNNTGDDDNASNNASGQSRIKSNDPKPKSSVDSNNTNKSIIKGNTTGGGKTNKK